MAHPQDVKDKLRRAYVFDNLSLEIAAAQQGVSFATARRWKSAAATAGDDWDKFRSANMIAGGGIEDIARAVLMGLIVQYQATLEALNTTPGITPQKRVEMLASLADAFNKATSASKKVLPETNNLVTAIDVIKQLALFIKTNYPQHMEAFSDVLEPFGREIERIYG